MCIIHFSAIFRLGSYQVVPCMSVVHLWYQIFSVLEVNVVLCSFQPLLQNSCDVERNLDFTHQHVHAAVGHRIDFATPIHLRFIASTAIMPNGSHSSPFWVLAMMHFYRGLVF